MAEIPTRLTSLLWDSKDPDAVYTALREKRCLSGAGLERRAAALAAIAQGEAKWRREVADPRACGATREWYIVAALMRSGFLNDRATKLMSEQLVSGAKPWWRFWR